MTKFQKKKRQILKNYWKKTNYNVDEEQSTNYYHSENLGSYKNLPKRSSKYFLRSQKKESLTSFKDCDEENEDEERNVEKYG